MSEITSGSRLLGTGLSAGLGLALVFALAFVAPGIPVAATLPVLTLWALSHSAFLLVRAREQHGVSTPMRAQQGWLDSLLLPLQGSALCLLMLMAPALVVRGLADRWLDHIVIGPHGVLAMAVVVALICALIAVVAALGLAGISEATLALSLAFLVVLATTHLWAFFAGTSQAAAVAGPSAVSLVLPPLMAVPMIPILAPVLRPARTSTLASALLGCGFALAVFLGASLMGSQVPVPRSWSVLMLVLVSPICGLTCVHLLVSCYEVTVALDREGLVPRMLLRGSQRLATPVVLLSVQVALIAAVAAWVPGDLIVALMITLGLLSSILMSARAVRSSLSGRQWVPLICAGLASSSGLWLLVSVSHERVIFLELGLLSGLGLALAMILFKRAARRLPPLRASTAELRASASISGAPVLTLGEAIELAPSYPARVLVAALDARPALIERALLRAEDEKAAYVLFVDKIGGLFYPSQVKPSGEALQVLADFCGDLDRRGFQGLPIWRVAHDPAASIAQAARSLGVERVIVGVPEARPLAEVLRGQTLSRLRKMLGNIALEVVRPQTEGE